MAEGHSNAQLARMLWVTEQTVKFHLSNIYRKLNVSNRTEASRWAQVHGLLPTPDGAGHRGGLAHRRPKLALRNGARPPPDQSGAAARALRSAPKSRRAAARASIPRKGRRAIPLGLRRGPAHPGEGRLEGRLTRPRYERRLRPTGARETRDY